MSLNWIDLKEFSFNSLLLMERFQFKGMLTWHNSDEWRHNMGVALHHNPAVLWAIEHRCPECASVAKSLADAASGAVSAEDIRNAELYVMGCIEDFVTYTRPEIMDESCDFIYAWDKQRLFELAEFDGKCVLDVGSGSGRLAFAAAERAQEVYASEPVSTLREYMKDKILKEGIQNVRVVDGMVDSLPYPDNTFDIVMSGHVVGDDYDKETAELIRITKPGGWILDCPGEDARKREPDGELCKRGWEQFHYVSKLGGDVYRHRIQVVK